MKTKIEIIDFSMISHMAMNRVHSCLYKGTIKANGSLLNEKEIRKEVHTKRNAKSGKFGKSESLFYINEKGSPNFETIESFLDYYNCELIHQKVGL